MPRAKTTVPGRARRRKVLKAAKGNYSGRRKLFKTALQTLQRAGNFAYEHRRNRKRDFRRLWITRITAACRTHGMLYSRFIHSLKQAGIELDRKVLSDMAIHDPGGFGKLVEKARGQVVGA